MLSHLRSQLIATAGAYNRGVDDIRAMEFPMLKGTQSPMPTLL